MVHLDILMAAILIPINELRRIGSVSLITIIKKKLFMLYAEVETDQDLEKIF